MMDLPICLDEEEKNALVCGICFELYDVETRVPKFLHCHHTCCLSCLRSLVRYQRLECPFCRDSTWMVDVSELKTNFYIMPKVQKVDALRKKVECMQFKTKDNWQKTRALRKKLISKLKAVENGLKLVKGTFSFTLENNEEKFALMSAFMEKSSRDVVEELLSTGSRQFEVELEDSKDELELAVSEENSFASLEKYTFSLILQDQTGKRFVPKGLHNEQLSFQSADESYTEVVKPLISYIVYDLKTSEESLIPLQEESATSIPKARRTRSTSGSWTIRSKSRA